MTLLEVLCALAILATLLSGLLLAKSRAMRQQALAERRLEAVAAADELIQQWWSSPSPPAQTNGEVPRHPDLYWRMRILNPATARSMPFAIACLEVIAKSDQEVLAHVRWFTPRSTDKSTVPEQPNRSKTQ